MTVFLAAVKPISSYRLEVQAIKTLIVFVFLIGGFRFLGKREAAQMNVYDLVMLMALANAVQNAMTGGLGNLGIGIVTSSTVIVAAWAISRLFRRLPGLESRFVGSPVLLAHDGKVLQPHLRRQRVTTSELTEACRQHGIEDPSDCAMAVLEVDGSISIIPKRPNEPPPLTSF
jgi:uncharacterized membrane protein YcaP (DUF421 family)